MPKLQLAYLFVYCFTMIDFIKSVPSFTYYDISPISNSTFSITLTADRPDLAATSKYFRSYPHHMCANEIWLIYWMVENYAYLYYNTAVLNDRCYVQNEGLWAGSARIAGKVGVTRLNLYSGWRYTNNATSIFENQTTIAPFRSIILIGDTSVEMYLQPNFGGAFSYCLRGSSTYVTLDDIVHIGIQPGDIKSLRFGCSSSKIIEIVPNQLNQALDHKY